MTNIAKSSSFVFRAGWGLDWLWPFLLGYPSQQVAFIDDICVIHPRKELQDPRKVSMYSRMQRPYGEEYEQFDRSEPAVIPAGLQHSSTRLIKPKRHCFGQYGQLWSLLIRQLPTCMFLPTCHSYTFTILSFIYLCQPVVYAPLPT